MKKHTHKYYFRNKELGERNIVKNMIKSQKKERERERERERARKDANRRMKILLSTIGFLSKFEKSEREKGMSITE